MIRNIQNDVSLYKPIFLKNSQTKAWPISILNDMTKCLVLETGDKRYRLE
jgi:hypothetical protein